MKLNRKKLYTIFYDNCIAQFILYLIIVPLALVWIGVLIMIAVNGDDKKKNDTHSEDLEYYDYGLEQDDYDWDHGAI